jgi:hypothetical protein
MGGRLDYQRALRMARAMKTYNDDVVAAVDQVEQARWGVVALRFSNGCREMAIEILDEPLDRNVRIYTGD